jgi:hypothetical protein
LCRARSARVAARPSCTAPSYSAATRDSGHARSRRYRPPETGYWHTGGGSPASRTLGRSRLSVGDSAPGSARRRSARAGGTPARRRLRASTSSTAYRSVAPLPSGGVQHRDAAEPRERPGEVRRGTGGRGDRQAVEPHHVAGVGGPLVHAGTAHATHTAARGPGPGVRGPRRRAPRRTGAARQSCAGTRPRPAGHEAGGGRHGAVVERHGAAGVRAAEHASPPAGRDTCPDLVRGVLGQGLAPGGDTVLPAGGVTDAGAEGFVHGTSVAPRGGVDPVVHSPNPVHRSGRASCGTPGSRAGRRTSCAGGGRPARAAPGTSRHRRARHAAHAGVGPRAAVGPTRA